MSTLLSSADFHRLRSDAETRRNDLIMSIESARKELIDIERFLSRLEVTEQCLSMLSSDDETSASNVSPHRQPSSGLGLPEMVSRVLHLDRVKSSSGEKGEGLKPSEIAAEVERLFKETVGTRAVNAHVWYLFSKKRLNKKGRRYFLPTDVVPLESRLAPDNEFISKVNVESKLGASAG